MSTSSAVFGGLDHITPSSSEQLCYVHCNFCDTVLAVSVPCSSLFKIVTVRCGHCTNLLSVNMRALLLPPSNSLHLAQTFLAPTTHNSLLEEMSCPQPPPPPPPLLVDQITSNTKDSTLVTPVKRVDQTPVNRPPEKRQRVPSAYNRFIKDEIQRIKARNPDITHREAFSAAAKNWAHFPHIQFGLMPEGQKKKGVHQQISMHHIQGGDHDLMLKDGFYATAPGSTAAANVGVSPF